MNSVQKYHWVFAGVGGGGLLGCGALYFIYQQMTSTGLASGIIGSILLGLWVWLDARRETLPGRKEAVQFGLTSLLIVMVSLSLTIVLQSLAVRFDTRWDLTTEGRFTLSDHGQSVVEGLDKDVTVYAIFRKGSYEGEAFNRMAKGAAGYSRHIKRVQVDPLFDVALLREVVQNENERELGRLSEYGTVVMITDNQRQRLDGTFTETAFIDALIRLNSEERHQVCWSVGHGERAFDEQTDPSGMGLIVGRMLDQNYVVRETRVISQGVPSDCALFVVAGPQTDWLPEERDALATYIAFGGRALVLLDPALQGVDIEDFAADFSQYGLVVGSDFVIEGSADHRQINAENEPLQLYYGSNLTVHPIVEMPDAVWAIQLARSVRWQGTESGGQVGRTLIEASEQSWAETDIDLAADSMPVPDEGELMGRVGLGAVVEITEPRTLVDDAPEDAKGRLVVFGDSDFASNQLSALGRNGDVFLNAVAWLVGEDNQLGEREPGDAEFIVLSGVQLSLALLLALGLAPSLSLGLGIWVFVRRRLG